MEIYFCYLMFNVRVSTFCDDICWFVQELQKENNNLSSQLEQGGRKLSQLEEERKTWEQNLKRSQNMVEDLRGRLSLSDVGFCLLLLRFALCLVQEVMVLNALS